MSVWMVGFLGWATCFILAASRIYRAKRSGNQVPRFMWVMAAGWLIFSIMCVLLHIWFDDVATVMRWTFALSPVLVLAAMLLPKKEA